MCEQSSPDPQAKPLSSISALYPHVLLAVKPVHLEPGQSHCAHQHREATKVVQENREVGVQLTHSEVSYCPSLWSIGLSGS